MQIPILNIYYLLCYSWDRLQEAEKISAGASDYKEAINLFARVLINGCHLLLKKGLDRDYNSVAELYSGIKGKIDFTRTINGNYFEHGKAICEFDEFEYNTLQNQLLKATFLRLSRIKELDKNLSKEVKFLYYRFAQIDDIEPQLALFSKVRIHRNNFFYDLLLKISKMIIEATVLNEDGNSYAFKDFIREDKAMAALFESFVRNFYRKEQSEFKISSPKIGWIAEALEDSKIDLLPEMKTDIVLESENRKLVMDTKYYRETTSQYFGKQSFHSGNLYQVYSYLRNLEDDKSNYLNKTAEGILLYPTVNQEYEQSYIIGGHKIRLATVDLAKEWRVIHARLKNIIS